jgi:hypothetical protein
MNAQNDSNASASRAAERQVNQPSIDDRFIVVAWHGEGRTCYYIVEQMEPEELWEVAAGYTNDHDGAVQACREMNRRWKEGDDE